MKEKQVVTTNANANFQSLSGSSDPENAAEEYIHYRECWKSYPKNFYLNSIPMHLDIEASSLCNLNCSFCDKRSLVSKNQLGNLEFSLFQHIMDQFDKEHPLWGLKLSYRGEPLMNPKLIDMVEYAKKKGVLDVYFNTNGMLLTESVIRRLIEAKLDRISISIDGVNAEEYEAVRIGAKFDKLVKNLTRLKELRQEYQVDYPKIRIQTVRLENINLEKYLNTWKAFGDEVAVIDYKEESIREHLVDTAWACPQLWQRLTIQCDGRVYGCNNDDIDGLYLGSASEQSIKALWNSPILNEARLLHKNGESHKVSSCDGCPWRTTQLKKKGK